MSYILDALRKSEQERQAGALPADIPQWQQQQVSAGGSRWVLPLMVLLALLIVAALVANILTPASDRNDGVDATAVSSMPAGIADKEPGGMTSAESLSAPDAVLVPGDVLVDVPVDNTAANDAALNSSPASSQLPLTPAPVVVSNPQFVEHNPVAQPQEQQTAETQSTATEINESKADASRTMPPLDTLRRIPQLMINSHIYSPLAEKRSVIINNREWHEGDSLAAGVQLKEITPDGILLDADGWPVHVGRSKGWQAIP